MYDEHEDTRLKVEQAKHALDSVLIDDDKVVVVSMTGAKSTMTLRIINAEPDVAMEMLKVAIMHLTPVDPELLRRAH